MEVFAVGVEEACEGSHESGADLIGAESVWAREVDGGETLVVYRYAAFYARLVLYRGIRLIWACSTYECI